MTNVQSVSAITTFVKILFWITWKEQHLPEINSEVLNNYFIHSYYSDL